MDKKELEEKAENFAGNFPIPLSLYEIIEPKKELMREVIKQVYVAVATKVNEELQEALECAEHNCKVKQEYNDNQFNAIMRYREKAKELIKNIIRATWGEGWSYNLDWKVKAEQFLEE